MACAWSSSGYIEKKPGNANVEGRKATGPAPGRRAWPDLDLLDACVAPCAAEPWRDGDRWTHPGHDELDAPDPSHRNPAGPTSDPPCRLSLSLSLTLIVFMNSQAAAALGLRRPDTVAREPK